MTVLGLSCNSKSVGKCRSSSKRVFKLPFLSIHIFPMHFIDTHETLDLSNRTTFFHDNVVVMEVDNLLAGWPTYTIDFTPERPGPLVSYFYYYSIQLTSTYRSLFCAWRMLQAIGPPTMMIVKMRQRERGKSNAHHRRSRRTRMWPWPVRPPPSAFFCFYIWFLNWLYYRDGTRHVSAKPVQLHGIFKEGASIVRMREKFMQENDYTWPPRRGFRRMDAEPLTRVSSFMTAPAAVAALKLD